VLDPFETTIEIVEPTCEADVILVQAEDITAQVNNLTLDPGEPGNNLILLFADLAELAEDPLPLAEDQLQGDLARVLGCILAHGSAGVAIGPLNVKLQRPLSRGSCRSRRA
jgi:hypothetical protein